MAFFSGPLQDAQVAGDGVMGSEYASGRKKNRALEFRYRTRALIAYQACVERGLDMSAPLVLDLGAADGLTLLAIREHCGGGGQYRGIELSRELLDAAPPLPQNVELLAGDVTKLPPELESESYDIVTALAVLEHLPDPAACVSEAARCLRSEGVFVATCPNPFWDRVAGTLGMAKGDHHEQEMSIAAMKQLCTDAGLVEVESRRFMWAPVGVLPYIGLKVPPATGLGIDALVGKARLFDFGFVNQAIVAQKR